MCRYCVGIQRRFLLQRRPVSALNADGLAPVWGGLMLVTTEEGKAGHDISPRRESD